MGIHSHKLIQVCWRLILMVHTVLVLEQFNWPNEIWEFRHCLSLYILKNIFFSFHSVKLKHFQKFEDTTEALAAATAAVEGKLCKSLKKTLKKLVSEDVQNELLVADAKLGNAIKEKLELKCIANSGVQELMRCIRSQSESLLDGLPKKEMTAMALGKWAKCFHLEFVIIRLFNRSGTFSVSL